MSSRLIAWWFAVVLLVVVGIYVRQEPARRGTTAQVALQDLRWISGSWRCEPVDGETTYNDPAADSAWSGVCARDERNRLYVYVGYVGEQGQERRLASPRLHYPRDDGSWSYVTGRPTEIPLTGDDRLPLRATETMLQYAPGKKEAVLYWYQRGSQTFADEYRFRMSMIIQKLTREPTDAAIVRISTPIDARGVEEAFRSERELAPSLYGELVNRLSWS